MKSSMDWIKGVAKLEPLWKKKKMESFKDLQQSAYFHMCYFETRVAELYLTSDETAL